VTEERLKLAVFIDFDNIQIGVKDTLNRELDVSLVLEALKERGEVVTKVAYGDWPRAGEQSRQMTQHAVQMVQRNVTPRGDKNGADINLALDALEMAFNRPHINAFAIVGGDSDFIALVEKLKQYDKRVFVVGGRNFTSGILQRNCHEFIAYENLLSSGESARAPRAPRRGTAAARPSPEARVLANASPNVQRALKILADREVAPQLGLLKSTILQLDPTFTERDYGVGSFLEFVQKMEQEGLVRLTRAGRGYLVEAVESESPEPAAEAAAEPATETEAREAPAEAAEAAAAEEQAPEAPGVAPVPAPEAAGSREAALAILKQAVAVAGEKAPNRPLYMRHVRQALRAVDKNFDERQYGFRGFLDLLHEGQREGWLRLQRDRKGVWRVFPIVASADAEPPMAASPAAGPEAVVATEAVAELEPGPLTPAPEPITEAIEEPELVTPEVDWSEAQPVLEDLVVEEEAVQAGEAVQVPEPEVPAPRKPRKRAPRSKTGTRRASTRRKKDSEEHSDE
jgi:uncharacterized protein (TIGR00288 family)